VTSITLIVSVSRSIDPSMIFFLKLLRITFPFSNDYDEKGAGSYTESGDAGSPCSTAGGGAKICASSLRWVFSRF
jgi:hypothetical protein